MTSVRTQPATTRAQIQAGRQRPGRRGWRWLLVAAAAVVLVTGLAVGAEVRLAAPPPTAAVQPQLSADETIPGAAPLLPWPKSGEAAVSVPGIGYDARSGTEAPVPVGSLTKLMTAYLVLRDHPLALGQQGPTITMDAADVEDWNIVVGLGESNVKVVVGEQLTERQLLEGMVVHSASDLADVLATWDAGSLPAFVAKMNVTAHALGLRDSHFTDASGLNSTSESTPADALRLAQLDMASATFAQVAGYQSVGLPVAGTVTTFTPLVGTLGVVGVKSGYTAAAGGCDVLALRGTVGGQTVTVLAAVTGQQGPDPLLSAGEAALAVAGAALKAVVGAPAMTPHEEAARVAVLGSSVPAQLTGRPPDVLGEPGQVVHRRLVVTDHPRAGARAGTPVGYVTATLGHQHVTGGVETEQRLPSPTLAQRLL